MRTRVLGAVLGFLVVGQVAAQAPPQPIVVDMTAASAAVEGPGAAAHEKRRGDYDIGPLRFSLGPTDSGGFGASLTGDGLKHFTKADSRDTDVLFGGSHLSTDTALGYSVDAGWLTDEDAANNASVSLKPTLQLMWTRAQLAALDRQLQPEEVRKLFDDAKQQKLSDCIREFQEGKSISIDECTAAKVLPKPHVYANLFADFRYRYGNITENQQVVRVNQAILGGGVSLVAFTTDWSFIRQWPTLTLGYYTVQDTDSNAASVPEEIKSDYVKVGFSTKFNLGRRTSLSEARNDHLFRIHLDVDAGKPTEGADRDWQALYKAQLIYEAEGQVKPAITFRDGDEQGLDYDKELILGILFDLL